MSFYDSAFMSITYPFSVYLCFYKFHQFKSILFLINQWKDSNFKHGGKLFTFRFAHCVPLLDYRCTQMTATSLFLCRLSCRLFERVALLPLSVPLCFEPCLFLPSLCFFQRAAAFRLSNAFVDPHACIYTFPSSLLLAFQALESFI